jgi:hypothetical protein
LTTANIYKGESEISGEISMDENGGELWN